MKNSFGGKIFVGFVYFLQLLELNCCFKIGILIVVFMVYCVNSQVMMYIVYCVDNWVVIIMVSCVGKWVVIQDVGN